MVRFFLASFMSFFLLGVPGWAAEQETSPEALVKRVTDEVLAALRQEKSGEGEDRQRVIALIENKIAPHFDFRRMTSLAVGQAWRRASPEQQQVLTREFHTLLVRTYANALASYRNQTVAFKATKPGDAGEVTVRSQIRQPGGQPIALDYSLAKSGDEWKVYDVVVDNISLVTNYRNSFATEVDKGGIDGLITTLETKNRNLQAAPVGKGSQS